MNYYRNFGSLSSNSVATDIYNKRIKDKKRGIKEKQYDPESWVKLKHSRKGQRNINKKLLRENEELHQIQMKFKQRLEKEQ